MLNRIRRAVSLTRARHFSKGRHRRPLTPSQPPIADEPTLSLGRISDWASHCYSLTAEETALVRPYVLAWERRARQHPTVVVAPHLPTEARTALLGAC